MEDAEDDWDEVRSLDLGASTNSLFARKLLEINERLNKQLDMIKEIMERIGDYERR